MLQSRLFWKLFLGFTLVNLLTAAALVASTFAWQKEQATQLARQELETAAKLLSEMAEAWAREPSEANAAPLRNAAEQANVTLRVRREADGELLRVDPEGAEPTTGPLIRGRVALRDEGEPLGDLWTERPAATLSPAFASLWRRYAWYAPLLGLLMVAAGYGVIVHLVAPIRSLDRAATAIANGNYDQRAFVTNQDELGSLARSFNEMSEELGQRISQLQESDRRQATVLGGMIEGVIAIDDRQLVVFANTAASKLFDFYPPQVAGRPLLEVVRSHPLHLAAKAAIETRTPQRLEFDWDEHVLSVQVTPLVGEPAGAVVVLHDTTELRRLESLRRDFVANVSHELKTPLSTIKANAETLLLGAVDDKEHRTRFLTGIEEQSERLGELIQDMLNLARIESAQQPFQIDTVSVSEAILACLNDYAPRADAKEIRLTGAGDAGWEAANVKADRKGLRVILNNLVDNALKYTPDGGEVRVSWGAASTGQGPMLRIDVSDNGIGIPEEKVNRVFERFFRADEARSRDMGGTGLGLSIVKHLAQSFGGGVAVENLAGGGTLFTVTLPAG